MIEYRLIRSNRKTIAIHISRDAIVEVRAPRNAPKADIDRFVSSNRDWIAKHLSAREQHVRNRAEFCLNYGDTVLMRGEEYPIAAIKSNRAGFDGECFYLPPDLPPEEIKRRVIKLYRRIAKQLLTDKVTDCAKLTGVTPSAVKINGAKTRWGSCSGKNSINFSWRLIMADDDVIDYVVAHELTHIKEHNHSDRFWASLADVMPDYRKRRLKLRAFQKRFVNEDWD